MKLLTEFTDYKSLEIITEQVEGKPTTYRVKGPFLQAEVRNRNGRVYSGEVLQREVKIFNEQKIATKRAMGELDHPPTPSVNLERVSHLIESLYMDGNNGIGVAKLLDTPCGRIAKSLVDEGVSLGVSTRGVGSLDGAHVNKDYKLITVDLVADPSAPNAFVDGILENREFIIENDRIVEVAIQHLEKDIAQKADSSSVLKAVVQFLDEVRCGWSLNR